MKADRLMELREAIRTEILADPGWDFGYSEESPLVEAIMKLIAEAIGVDGKTVTDQEADREIEVFQAERWKRIGVQIDKLDQGGTVILESEPLTPRRLIRCARCSEMFTELQLRLHRCWGDHPDEKLTPPDVRKRLLSSAGKVPGPSCFREARE